MELSTLPFYLVAAFILTMGVLTVTTQRLFRSAIWLLFSLIGIAALYFLLEVEFAAAVQIIVYVGGIVVLIIFSIFLTNQEGVNMPQALARRKLFSGLAVASGAAWVIYLLQHQTWMASGTEAAFDPSVQQIGRLLVGNTPDSYVIPFELVSILLLAAMIGCIVIAIKSRPEEK